MSTRNLFVYYTKTRYLLLLVALLAVVLFAISLRSIYPSIEEKKLLPGMATKTISDFWKTHDFLSKTVPVDVDKRVDEIVIISGTKKINGLTIFYREAAPPGCKTLPCKVLPNIHILLLHGAAFSSKTWAEDQLKTLHRLSLMGHRALAIDLPGYGESKTSKKDKDTKPEKFLQDVIKAFNLRKPVIISPSMSGSYSVPYLIEHWNDMTAYIPVAPVAANLLEDSVAKTISLPTLVVYGELDRGLGSASAIKFGNMPCSAIAEIPKGAHPAYLTDPPRFHQLLYNFLEAVKDKKTAPVLA